MISSLDRKLLRDMSQMKGQVFAIALVVAAGVATFVNSRTILHSLEVTRATFYERYRFAEVFARVKRAPDSIIDRLAEVPGVAQVGNADRRKRDARRAGARRAGRRTADLAAGDARAGAQPGLHPPRAAALARPRRRGARQRGVRREERHGRRRLDRGDHQRQAQVAARSSASRSRPSTCFRSSRATCCPIRSTSASSGWNTKRSPTPTTWTAHSTTSRSACSATRRSRKSSSASISCSIATAASARLPARISFRTCCWKATSKASRRSACWRRRSFLSVAAFLLNVVMTRLTSLQREQIAALKAFGYSNLQIGWHYLKFVLLIAMVGGAIGTLGGMWLAHDFTKMFLRVYQYPELIFRVRPNVVANAILVAGGAAIAGAFGAICAGRAAAAGRSDAPRAARPLPADDPRTDRAGALRAECRPHDPPPARTASGENIILADGDRHVGGDRGGRQLHAQFGRQGDPDEFLRRAAVRPVAGHGRAGVDRRDLRAGVDCRACSKCEPRRIDRGAAAVAEPFAPRRHHGLAER